MKIKHFKTWSEAFDVCREMEKPIIAQVKKEKLKIFPSGAYKEIKKGRW
jgi:hypothetical protein